MRSPGVSLSYDFRSAYPVQAERSQVVNDPEGREGETGEGRADQREIRTEELNHPRVWIYDRRPP
jgi:hypothetical protein